MKAPTVDNTNPCMDTLFIILHAIQHIFNSETNGVVWICSWFIFALVLVMISCGHQKKKQFGLCG